MGVIDKQELYGKFQAQEDVDNTYANNKRDWRDRLDQKLRHKALDIALDPTADNDPVNVDARRTVTNSGLDWKHLAIIAATGLGGAGLYQLGSHNTTPTQPVPIVSAPDLTSQYKTEIEIRDAVTKKPIKIDWVTPDSK